MGTRQIGSDPSPQGRRVPLEHENGMPSKGGYMGQGVVSEDKRMSGG